MRKMKSFGGSDGSLSDTSESLGRVMKLIAADYEAFLSLQGIHNKYVVGQVVQRLINELEEFLEITGVNPSGPSD